MENSGSLDSDPRRESTVLRGNPSVMTQMKDGKPTKDNPKEKERDSKDSKDNNNKSRDSKEHKDKESKDSKDKDKSNGKPGKRGKSSQGKSGLKSEVEIHRESSRSNLSAKKFSIFPDESDTEDFENFWLMPRPSDDTLPDNTDTDEKSVSAGSKKKKNREKKSSKKTLKMMKDWNVEGKEAVIEAVDDIWNTAWEICSERFNQRNASTTVSLLLRDTWLQIAEMEWMDTDLAMNKDDASMFLPDDPPPPLQSDTWARGALQELPVEKQESTLDPLLAEATNESEAPIGDGPWNNNAEEGDEAEGNEFYEYEEGQGEGGGLESDEEAEDIFGAYLDGFNDEEIPIPDGDIVYDSFDDEKIVVPSKSNI